MKKFVLPLFSCLLVLSLLLGSFTTAKAAPGDDPVVTPVSGDTDFTTEVVAIASLPGVVELEDGMLAPLGFPAGEAQFGGNGIVVKGFDSGKATACFSLSAVAVNEGWGGKVAVWDGAKWVRLATSITTSDETNTAIACATITGSGTYAFIKYVTEPDKLPTMSACNYFIFFFPDFVGSQGEDGAYRGTVSYFIFMSLDLHAGMNVTVRSLGTEPPGAAELTGTGRGVLESMGLMFYSLALDTPMEYTIYPAPFDTWDMLFTFDGCSQVLQMGDPRPR